MMTGRITNFNNRNDTIRAEQKGTVLSFEFWSFSSEPIWNMCEDELITAAKSDLMKAGIADADHVLDSRVIRVPNCYPVYDTGYQAEVLALSQFVDSFPQLYAIGRYGSFKYNNQDHSLLMGMLAADNISLGTKHDLWSINSDTEYQEGSRITSTGLVLD
jgi:protoporphyrinogen oxidase